jgi:hypothetical protein
MDESDSEIPASLPHSSARSIRRRLILLSVASVSIVVIASLTLTVTGGWAPLLHWTCQKGGAVAELTNYYIPAVLVNSPYGGRAWGNGTFPVTFPGVWNGLPPPGVTKIGFGTGASMGETLGAFFTVNVSFYRLGNVTAWGPGANVRCSQPFEVVLQPPTIYAEAGGGIMGPNNTSDSTEPSFALIYEGTQDQIRSLFFDNAFEGANAADISTCGGPAQSIPSILSSYLSVWFPVTIQGQNLTIPYIVPVEESYHYWFPADFGTWQIDNLSAPGGPGGGWALSYSPCP